MIKYTMYNGLDLNINVITDSHCKVIVEDRTEYLDETSEIVEPRAYKKSETVSIIVLKQNKPKETVTRSTTFNCNKYLLIPIDFDGWFTIHFIVLPNKVWFDREKSVESGSALSMYNIVYYSDNEHIYKYVDGKISEAHVDELLEVNPNTTTILRTCQDYVSICYLQNCYINLCQQIFDDRGFSRCWNKSTIDSELIYKRDMVWMTINVVKYLTEFNQLSEIARIIDIVNSCNGLCKSNETNASGCGCSKE